jgi:hypothetical protein
LKEKRGERSEKEAKRLRDHLLHFVDRLVAEAVGAETCTNLDEWIQSKEVSSLKSERAVFGALYIFSGAKINSQEVGESTCASQTCQGETPCPKQRSCQSYEALALCERKKNVKNALVTILRREFWVRIGSMILEERDNVLKNRCGNFGNGNLQLTGFITADINDVRKSLAVARQLGI